MMMAKEWQQLTHVKALSVDLKGEVFWAYWWFVDFKCQESTTTEDHPGLE